MHRWRIPVSRVVAAGLISSITFAGFFCSLSLITGMIKFPRVRPQPVFLFDTGRIFACNRGNVILRGTRPLFVSSWNRTRIIKSAPFPRPSRLFASEPTHARVFCPSSFFRSSRLTSAAYFRTRYALTFAKTAYSSLTNFPTWREKVKRGKGGEGENGSEGSCLRHVWETIDGF